MDITVQYLYICVIC